MATMSRVPTTLMSRWAGMIHRAGGTLRPPLPFCLLTLLIGMVLLAGCATRRLQLAELGTMEFSAPTYVRCTGYVIRQGRREPLGPGLPIIVPSAGVSEFEVRKERPEESVQIDFKLETFAYNVNDRKLDVLGGMTASIPDGHTGLHGRVLPTGQLQISLIH